MNLNKLFIVILILSVTALIFFFTSCNLMKKDVMNDICDNVEEAVITESNGKYVLVTREEIFQAQTKSSENGIRQITGYTEYRLSSYDLNTGELLKRIVLGDRKENECTYLGMTDGRLWYKSVNPEFGFHARDPVTLEIIVPEKNITSVNPFLENNISNPEWNSIKQFFGFDIDKNMPVLSDNSGFLYLINPVSFKAEKFSSRLENFQHDDDPLTSSITLSENNHLNMNGSPRNHLQFMNKDFEEPSFLNGSIIKNSYEGYIPADYLTGNLFLGENQNTNKSTSKLNNPDPFSFVKGSIITADRSIFILSQTDVTDQAKIIISKVKINTDGAELKWQTVLENIYRDPDKGIDKSEFDVVFSKGNPDLSTMLAATGDNKLVLIYMLKATCVDMNSGKVLWSIDL